MRPVDVAIVTFALWSGAVIALGAPTVAGWPWLLAGRVVLVAAVLALARAARANARIRRLRELYPLVAVPPFFWEAPLYARTLHGGAWAFEERLLTWDRALLGGPSTPETFGLPAAGGEALWLLYFTYYPIVAAGLALAWGRRARPGPDWERVLTAAALGFLGAYALFPLFPARAPVHALAGVEPATGAVFGSLVGWIQSWGGVTGGAFPSAHVSAAWAISLALSTTRPRVGGALIALSAGMTVACVWTPYHWAADAVAGLAVGAAAGLIVRWIVN